MTASAPPLDAQAGALCAWLRDALGADRVDWHGGARLAGGAIQDNWRIAVGVRGGPWDGARDWVLRRSRASRVGEGRSRAEEFALLRAARAAGVAVPRPVAASAGPEPIGSDFLVMEWVDGVAAGHRLVRDDGLVPDRRALARGLGEQMARIHGLRPPQAGLPFLEPPAAEPARDAVERLRRRLDRLPRAMPVVEWGLHRLLEHLPPPRPAALVHRDYRTGNYLVHAGRPAAILDWEFAGWGDPHEDIGWFFARCWRFGRHERRAGGVGDAADFVAGYVAASGKPVDDDAVRWWERYAHLRWAVIAAEQAERSVGGGERTLELALTGRLVSTLEAEILADQGVWA